MTDIIATMGESGKKYDPVPAGVHIARCYGIFDVGTHRDEKYDKNKRLIIISWELPDERGQFPDKDGNLKDLPRAISQTYTLSLGERASLRRDLQNWRGKDFTQEELKGFSLKNILGKSCQIQVVHTVKGDKTWANISAIMSLPKGMEHKTPENPLVMWAIGDPTDGVPAWILRKAEQSLEWDHTEVVAPPPAKVEEEDNVPF